MNDGVFKILNGYLSWLKIAESDDFNKLSYDKKDDFRIKYDEDAKYYYETMNLNKNDALHADTIISFWSIYNRLLFLETGWRVFKTFKSIQVFINEIKMDTFGYSKKIQEVNQKVNEFAKLTYTKGNFMLLPSRAMNTQRYEMTQDRIDSTLYQCFGKGLLSKFFESEDKLIEWIKRENLHKVCFNGDISKDNIKWFVDEKSPKLITEMNINEINEYINNASKLIEDRNEILNRTSETNLNSRSVGLETII